MTMLASMLGIPRWIWYVQCLGEVMWSPSAAGSMRCTVQPLSQGPASSADAQGVKLQKDTELVKVLTFGLSCCREHEMAANLLSSLYHEIIQADQMQKGFKNLLNSVDDLKLDVPSAEDDLGLFLARAVIDDILPPAFLQKVSCGEQRALFS